MVPSSNIHSAAIDSLIPNGGYSMQNPMTQNPMSQNSNQNNTAIMGNNIQNQVQQAPNYNELISQIQKAAASGTTALPSRDIPIDQIKLANDNQTQPNYIPPPRIQEDYIKNNETPQQVIQENNNKINISNLYDTLFYEMQLPIIIALLYFLFQLPTVKKHSKNMLPFLFKDDGNPNLYGFIFNSVMFASMVYVLLKVVTKLPK
jgi:sensor c-di-GMP phosphodiesterase-like protein